VHVPKEAVKIARIGFLGFAPASAWSSEVNALRAGLHELGYVEGKNIAFEFQWATSVAEMSILANKLVRTNVDIIFAPASTWGCQARSNRKWQHARQPCSIEVLCKTVAIANEQSAGTAGVPIPNAQNRFLE